MRKSIEILVVYPVWFTQEYEVDESELVVVDGKLEIDPARVEKMFNDFVFDNDAGTEWKWNNAQRIIITGPEGETISDTAK